MYAKNRSRVCEAYSRLKVPRADGILFASSLSKPGERILPFAILLGKKLRLVPKNAAVPILLKRNWIHKRPRSMGRGVERGGRRCVHLAFRTVSVTQVTPCERERLHTARFLFPSEPKGCAAREKARVPLWIFSWPLLSHLLASSPLHRPPFSPWRLSISLSRLIYPTVHLSN